MTAMSSLSRTALPLSATILAASASAATLIVVVEGAQGRQGVVYAAIFRDTAGWLKPDSAVRADIATLDSVSNSNVIFVYTDPPARRYVLLVFHDANNDGKLGTNPTGTPIEPYGLSRDARGRFDPPAFDDTAIDAQGDQRVTTYLH